MQSQKEHIYIILEMISANVVNTEACSVCVSTQDMIWAIPT